MTNFGNMKTTLPLRLGDGECWEWSEGGDEKTSPRQQITRYRQEI